MVSSSGKRQRPVAPSSSPTPNPLRLSRAVAVRQRLAQHRGEERFQHELKEMQETGDLRQIDDDVEEVATLYEWHAPEHTHRPKSPGWFAALAAATTVVCVGFILLGNLIAALSLAIAGGLIYYVAQKEPATLRYRLMVDGIALNNTLYHYRDLHGFNIIYEPGETKTILFRGIHKLSPLIHMELGEADPVAIRDILLEFLREDHQLNEPLVDVLARRLGF